MEKWKKRALFALEKAGKKGLSFAELQKKCRIDKADRKPFQNALNQCVREGTILEKKGRFLSAAVAGRFPGVVKGLRRTYGFVALDDGREVFVLGSRFLGALPGDRVLLKLSRRPRGGGPRGDSPEGEIVEILAEGREEFSGILRKTPYGTVFVPDALPDFPMAIQGGSCGGKDGDKATAQVVRRGETHRDHTVRLTGVYGSAQSAAACCEALAAAAGVSPEFPDAVLDEARYLEHKGIPDRELSGRLDLRDQVIFTIDGADSKDLDDAVSLEKEDGFYRLGVHIADVSHYVRPGSRLDREACARGTSIYYADKVIPMLPKELSNGICSLNPQEDRLAFSALITLSEKGELVNSTFRKTIIRSRVKGVYGEVNALLAGDSSPALRAKYREVLPFLPVMKELKDLRLRLRQQRGAPELDVAESRILLDGDGRPVEVLPRQSGEAERIIEEFMLLANEAAASLAREKEIPFVYRVHEAPDPERISSLKEIMEGLGLPAAGLSGRVPPKTLAMILEEAKGKPAAPILHRLALRAMAKARYWEKPIGHYGLALENYAHFTSPIRRYPDLAVHRLLTSFLTGDLRPKRDAHFAAQAAANSTQRELLAVQLERDCEGCYKAEYMASHVGEEFDGVISSVASFGFFVELPSTVEGLVPIEDLPDGEYFFDGVFSLQEIRSGRRFKLGDPVRVRCLGADVSAGQVDFALVE